MKNIITILLLLFIFTACNKKEEKEKENVIDNLSKGQAEQTIVTDNITENAADNKTKDFVKEKELPKITYIDKTVVLEDIIPLNNADLEPLLSKHYSTDKIRYIGDIYQEDKYNALKLSLQYGYLDIADELLKGVKLNEYLKSFIIENLAVGGNIENMKFLEKYNITLNDANESVFKVYRDSSNKFLAYKMAEYLLEQGADVNASDGYTTTLSYAWNKASLDLLIKHNADLDVIVYSGSINKCGTYLVHAAKDKLIWQVNYLLDLGVNPFAPVDWYKNEYMRVFVCKVMPEEENLSLYKSLSEAFYLYDENEDLKDMYNKSIYKYSPEYFMDYMVNEDKATNEYFGTDMYDNEYLFDYIDSFYLSDDNLENNDLIYNANAIKKEFKIYTNIPRKKPYLQSLLQQRVNDGDYIHIQSASAYISLLINNGINIGENTKDNNMLYYILQNSDDFLPYELINYISSYIYKEGQDKKEAVKNIMTAAQKAGIKQDDGKLGEYIYRMYAKYNK